MNKERRNPLAKEHFGEGIRQKWTIVYGLFALSLAIMKCLYPHFDPAPFLQYMTFSYPVIIAGMTVSANNQEKATMFGSSSSSTTTISS